MTIPISQLLPSDVLTRTGRTVTRVQPFDGMVCVWLNGCDNPAYWHPQATREVERPSAPPATPSPTPAAQPAGFSPSLFGGGE